MMKVACPLLGRKGRMLTCFLLVSMPIQAVAQEVWTLESSVQRTLDVAPEYQDAAAAVRAQQGALQQAGAWPNPTIELRADDKIGKEEGVGGKDLTQLVISQPLPVSGRIGKREAVARANFSGAQATQKYQKLLLEAQAAQRFHVLQLAAARLGLAEQRLQLADQLQDVGRQREQAGELSKLERLRLDLIRESGQQILDKTEGEYNEALGRFRAYLGLSAETALQLTPLEPFGPAPLLEKLRAGLPEHPALLAAKHRLDASRSGVNLVRAERLPDPTLSLFRERDFLNGRRQDVTGVGIAVTVPLWDRKDGSLNEAQAQVAQSQSKLLVLERDINSRLQRSYLHLGHLIEQGKHFQVQVFEPAQKLFDLTRKAYASGEAEILSLVDANSTYFDAHERYLKLLEEAWQEAAELRLAAGRSLVATQQDTHHE